LQYWIKWQAKKHGMIVEFVNPKYSSVSCPKCGKKMKEVGYRYSSVQNVVIRMTRMLLQWLI